jgi:exodeoxyribonuclease V gamma subunit
VAGGTAHRARRIDDYLRGFADDSAPLPQGLPSRLFAFATLNVSPDVLRVIASQATSAPCISTCRRRRAVTGATW